MAYNHKFGLKDPRTRLKALASRNDNVISYKTPLGGKVLGVGVRSSQTGESFPTVFIPVPVGSMRKVGRTGVTFGGSSIVKERLASNRDPGYF